MIYSQVQPIGNYSSPKSNNIYSNPEYLRLMMEQMSSANVTSIFSGGKDGSNYDPFSGGASNSNFYSELIKANSSSMMTPQMELSIYGNLVGKTLTGISDGRSIKGKVGSVYLQNNSVCIDIDGSAFPSDKITIVKIE